MSIRDKSVAVMQEVSKYGSTSDAIFELRQKLSVANEAIARHVENGKRFEELREQLSTAKARIAELERESGEPVAVLVNTESGAHGLFVKDFGLLRTIPSGKYPLFTHPPLPVEQVPDGWISVEDRLPKGGTPVLVACGKKIIRAAHAGKFELDEENWGLFNDGYGGDYNEADDTTYLPEGWYEWNEFEETHWGLAVEPTHWMPLPAAPSPEGEKS